MSFAVKVVSWTCKIQTQKSNTFNCSFSPSR